jgi:hypothetical protein
MEPGMDTKQKTNVISAPPHIPTYAERHGKFNRLVDRNPWIKIYIAAILLAEATGCYLYAISKRMDAADLLEKFGFFGILGAILLVFLPLIVIRIREMFTETSD